MKAKKFYNFISANKKNELYVYGEIIGGSDKWTEDEVIFDDFKNKLEEVEDNSSLDIYINSPGGDVFTTQGIVAALRRAKDRGITINAYLDGIGASCASWMPMVADNIYVYPQSILMIHKPMSLAWGNADQMKKEIAVLDKIEDDVIIPLYMEKAKENVTVEMIKEKMAAETWFNAKEISEMFNVTMLQEERKIACCADRNVLNRYKNIPTELLNQLEETEVKDVEDNQIVETTENTEETTVVEEPIAEESTVESTEESTVEDNVVEEQMTEEETVESTEESTVESKETNEVENKIAELEETIQNLQNEKAELETKLNEANEKIINLNDKVSELQPIVEEYNNKLAAEEEVKNAAMLEEKKEYFKNKFDSLNARSKFESEEVQNLVNNCIKDVNAMAKLNTMIVDMITIENKPVQRTDFGVSVDNLIETQEDIVSMYGFK